MNFHKNYLRVIGIRALLLVTVFLCKCNVYGQGSEWTLSPKGIFFTQGGATLSSAAKQRLDTLAMIMQANPNFKVVIEGNAGNTKVGLKLSQQRVIVVIRYLVENGNIDWQRFMCNPKGLALDNQVFYRQPYDGEERSTCWKQ